METLTKLEYTCIKLGIPKSGNDELDELIHESERKRIASLALQGFMANKDADRFSCEDMIGVCLRYADELLNQLEE